MNNSIPLDVRDFLEKSVGENLDNFRVELRDKNQKGEGYMAEILFLHLTNTKTNEEHHLVLKQALPCGSAASLDFVSSIFQNEVRFYESIWPEMLRFQERFPRMEKFHKIPKYYAVNTKEGDEKISIDDVRYSGFRNHDKKAVFKSDELKFILNVFGKFHALSMAYRVLEPIHFRKISDHLIDNFKEISKFRFFQQVINRIFRIILCTLDEDTERDIVETIEVYAQTGSDIFIEALTYKGENESLTHGDSWSNNLMFKYDESGDIEDVRLIDFQFSTVRTVVFDLSFCIYTSASEEILNNLDSYLRIYHRSLSDSLRGYNLDPEVVYSYDVFKREWKQYSKLGLVMGLFHQSLRHIPLDSLPSLMESIDADRNSKNIVEIEDTADLYVAKTKQFLNYAKSLVIHAYYNKCL